MSVFHNVNYAVLNKRCSIIKRTDRTKKKIGSFNFFPSRQILLQVTSWYNILVHETSTHLVNNIRSSWHCSLTWAHMPFSWTTLVSSTLEKLPSISSDAMLVTHARPAFLAARSRRSSHGAVWVPTARVGSGRAFPAGRAEHHQGHVHMSRCRWTRADWTWLGSGLEAEALLSAMLSSDKYSYFSY